MEPINIVNVGPIRSLSIPVPEQGGVVVLRGRNGTGKTSALAATQRLLGGTDGVEARYGTPGGAVEGLGARLTVGTSRVREAGELVVSCLEGADPANFVDPGIADEERADARRIAELCRLTGSVATLGLFEEKLGDLRGIASRKTSESTDIPTMAALLKRDLQAAALEDEKEEAKLRGAAQALLAASEGVSANSEPPRPREDFDAEIQSEIEKRSALIERVRHVQRVDDSAEIARSKLAQAASKGPGIDSIEASQNVETTRSAVEAARSALREAQSRLNDAETALRLSEAKLREVVQFEDLTTAWQESIDEAAKVARVDPEAIPAADARIAGLRKAQADALLYGERRGKAIKALEALGSADGIGGRARARREAAGMCEDVVTEQIARVAPAGLRVHEGRLVLDRDGKVETFSKLSHGEKWKIALDIAIDAMPATDALKVLVVNQEAWEGLDPENRATIAEHARARRCVVITAEASDGAIRADVE